MVTDANMPTVVVARMQAGEIKYVWPDYTLDATTGAEPPHIYQRTWVHWCEHFAATPHAATEELVGLDAYVDRHGWSYIVATCKVNATGELVFRGVWFNQHASDWQDGQEECPGCRGNLPASCEVCEGQGYLGRMTDADELEQNECEWLDSMAGCGLWPDAGQTWERMYTGPRAACLGAPEGYRWVVNYWETPTFRLVPLDLAERMIAALPDQYGGGVWRLDTQRHG